MKRYRVERDGWGNEKSIEDSDGPYVKYEELPDHVKAQICLFDEVMMYREIALDHMNAAHAAAERLKNVQGEKAHKAGTE